MSRGRAARRKATASSRTRWAVRRFDHELSAESRAWVARVIAAHDDPRVDVATYWPMLQQFGDYLQALPEAERVECGMQLHQHAVRALTGRQGLTAVAIEVAR